MIQHLGKTSPSHRPLQTVLNPTRRLRTYQRAKKLYFFRTNLHHPFHAIVLPAARSYFTFYPNPSGIHNYIISEFKPHPPSRKKLPVLEAVLNKALEDPHCFSLDHTAVIYVHHALQTSVKVLEALLSIKAKPNNIFVIGKHYSECPEVVEQIKALGIQHQPCSPQDGIGKFSQNFTFDIFCVCTRLIQQLNGSIKNVLILDHGGRVLDFFSETWSKQLPIIGIEKTTAGFIDLNRRGMPHFPLIGVAHCAAKKIIESPLVAEAIVKRLPDLEPINGQKPVCGIVGYGAIGKAIATKLLGLNYPVIIYDHDASRLDDILLENKKSDLSELIIESDYIFGCTGRDIFANEHVLNVIDVTLKNKVFVSCSSEDKEFLSLLIKIRHTLKTLPTAFNPLNDIDYYNTRGALIRVMRGGFPINFDHSGESVPANDIQLTRALVFGGVLQAIRLFDQLDGAYAPHHTLEIYKLCADLQKLVVQEWLACQPTTPAFLSQNLLDGFQNEDWINEHSGGDLIAPRLFSHCDSRNVGAEETAKLKMRMMS